MTTKVTSVIEVFTKDRSSKTLKSIGRVGAQAFKLLAGAAVGVVAGLATITVSSAKATDAINELAKRTGTSIEFMSGFAFAADQADLSVGQFQTGLVALGRRTAAMPEIFKKWGISTKGANGQLASVEIMLGRVADRMKKAGSQAERLAIGQDVMSETGRIMVPLLSQGAAGLKKFHDEAKRLGLIISPLSAAIADELNNELGRLKFETQAVGREITNILAPIFIQLSREIRKAAGSMALWIKANDKAISDAFLTALVWMGDTGLPAIATGANIVAKSFLGWNLAFNLILQAFAVIGREWNALLRTLRGSMADLLTDTAILADKWPKVSSAIGLTGAKLRELAQGFSRTSKESAGAANAAQAQLNTLKEEGAAALGLINQVDAALAKLVAGGAGLLKSTAANIKALMAGLNGAASVPDGGGGGGGGGGPRKLVGADFGGKLAMEMLSDANVALSLSEDKLAAQRDRAIAQQKRMKDATLARIAAEKNAFQLLGNSLIGIGASMGAIFGQMKAGTISAAEAAKKAGLAALDMANRIIMSLAATAAAKALDAHAYLPFVGIVIGSGLAAAAFAAISAYAGSFERGGIIPRTGTAQVHQGELVLPRREVPAALAAGFGGQDADPRAGGVGPGGITINQNMLLRPSRTTMDEVNRDDIFPSARRLAVLGHG